MFEISINVLVHILKPISFIRGVTAAVVMVVVAACSTPKTYSEGIAQWHPNSAAHQLLETDDLIAEVNAGSNEAMFDLAVRYMKGDRIGRDEVMAVKTIEDIARDGDPRAQYLLGSAYISGSGVEKDESIGVEWLERSAKQGYFNGEYWYGFMLTRGRGIEKPNWHEGLKWIRRAAQNGHEDAQFSLGEAYESCRGGLKRDFDKAAMWYRRADNNGRGNMLARYNLRRLIDLGLVDWQEGDGGAPPLELVDVRLTSFEPCEDGQIVEIFQ